MSYCVAMQLKNGLIFMSDTRTNAGVDNISQFCKLFTFEKKNERFITLLAAGNLATTQSVISLLEERNKAPTERGPSIMEAPSMFQVARLVGDTLREVIQRNSARTACLFMPLSTEPFVILARNGCIPRPTIITRGTAARGT